MKYLAISFIYLHVFTVRITESREVQYSSGPKGSGTCSEGEVIMEKAECKDACRKLGVTLANTEVRIVGGYACYSDSHGHCFQNGKNGTGASMICKVSEDKENLPDVTLMPDITSPTGAALNSMSEKTTLIPVLIFLIVQQTYLQ